MNYKAIFKGQLDFGTQRSYDRVIQLYDQRVETYYKARVLFKSEEIFDAPTKTLNLGKRIANNTNKKHINNTLALLNYCSQFAVSGNIGIWTMKEGTLKTTEVIEPSNDRSSVLSYISGRESLKQGKNDEAIAAFSKTLEKYSKHSYAYDGLGDAYMGLGEIEKAKEAYTRSIEAYHGNVRAHYAMAKLWAKNDDHKKAVVHFDAAIKHSIPHEPVFWESRYLKGLSLLELKEFEKATAELKFFTRRNFLPEDPNHKYLRLAFFKYGHLLRTSGALKEGRVAFRAGMKIEVGKDQVSDKQFRAAIKMKAEQR